MTSRALLFAVATITRHLHSSSLVSDDDEENTNDQILHNSTNDDDDDAWQDFAPPRGMIYMPKVAAALSLLGSSILLAEICHDVGRRRSITAIATVLGNMSVADLFYSTAWFLSTWPVPKQNNHNAQGTEAADDLLLGYNLRGTNVGTTGTCTAQGVVLEVGGAASAYFYAFLALCYLWVVQYNWRERRMQRVVHVGVALCWSLAVTGALLPLAWQMYNFSWYVCWIQAYPLGCLESWQVGAENSTCTRGDNAFLYSIIVQVIPRWLCFFACLVVMGIIFQTVRRLENRNAAYVMAHPPSRQPSSKMTMLASNHQNISDPSRASSEWTRQRTPPHLVNRRRSQAVAWQGIFYCCAIFVAFCGDLISYVLSTAAGVWNEHFDVVAYTFTPMAGFFNLLIFMRTRAHMQTRLGRVLRRLFCASKTDWQARMHRACCCLCKVREWCRENCRQRDATGSMTQVSQTNDTIEQQATGSNPSRHDRTSSQSSSKVDRVIATSEWILEEEHEQDEEQNQSGPLAAAMSTFATSDSEEPTAHQGSGSSHSHDHHV